MGAIIIRLRKKHDVTQEKLAEYLGISFQAVSKWENGTAFPDITLIPALANFLGVTADELFGIGVQENQRKVDEYEREYARLSSLGDIKGIIALMRGGLEQFPKHYRFMLYLAGGWAG